MKKQLTVISAALLLLCAASASGQESYVADSTAQRLVSEGYANVRAFSNESFTVYTVENDRYKIQAEGIARAARMIAAASSTTDEQGKVVKLIVTDRKVPKLTMTYDQESGRWTTTSRLDWSWSAVNRMKVQNSSFGKVDITLYPQVALMNLIITQVYQSLWQISPSIDVSLWPGAKFSFQVKFPLYNDGYGYLEDKIHPGMITLSQQFRDPWNLNVFGKVSLGFFNNNRYGAALDLKYIFPNERFSIDGQAALLSMGYFYGFNFHYENTRSFNLRWNVAANYYWPAAQTQFTLRVQQFLMGDYGAKFEMIRHFRHCSIGFYAMKGLEGKTNGGFRFQIALPPYRMKRHGYIPRITTSGQMGLVYNANNEQYYYKEFRDEASDNIMSLNAFNPYYVAGQLEKY